jgi:hypothetical protein
MTMHYTIRDSEDLLLYSGYDLEEAHTIYIDELATLIEFGFNPMTARELITMQAA